MTRNLDEEYRLLEQTRTLLNPMIISDKKKKIKIYFSNCKNVDLSNLERQKRKNIILYKAPTIKIHGSFLSNWSTNIVDDIYIDESLLSDEKKRFLINHQLTHEILHSLCRTDSKKRFGHVINEDTEFLRGINEACTQMFTDDIEGCELDEADDYLYFIKNIMRIMKNVIGSDALANQYLNNDIFFEEKFNEFTNNRFNDFAHVINYIYYLSKTKHYNTIADEENEDLVYCQNQILDFTRAVVSKTAESDVTIYTRLIKDFSNKDFLFNWILITY